MKLHGFRDKALHFQRRTHGVALLLLRALAIALGRDEHSFEEPFQLDAPDNPSFIAWNKYPAVAPDDAAKPQPPRLHAHADMDVLTILFQRVGAVVACAAVVSRFPAQADLRGGAGDVGLEIAPGSEVENPEIIEDIGNIWNAVPVARTWTPLDPKPGCLTVNIGDGLTRWTDGLLKSTYHRVRTPGAGENLVSCLANASRWLRDSRPLTRSVCTSNQGERYSMPYFLNAKLNYEIQGPSKRWPPLTGYDLLAKTGAAYEARKNDPTGAWQAAAYGQPQAAS